MRNLLLTTAALGLAACAGTAPSDRVPACGHMIPAKDVVVLDARSFGQDADALDAWVRGQVGDYRLVTEQPVAIPDLGRRAPHDGERVPEQPLYRAADLGCDLVLLLEEQKDATYATARWGRGDYTIVHIGSLAAAE